MRSCRISTLLSMASILLNSYGIRKIIIIKKCFRYFVFSWEHHSWYSGVLGYQKTPPWFNASKERQNNEKNLLNSIDTPGFKKVTTALSVGSHFCGFPSEMLYIIQFAVPWMSKIAQFDIYPKSGALEF